MCVMYDFAFLSSACTPVLFACCLFKERYRFLHWNREWIYSTQQQRLVQRRLNARYVDHCPWSLKSRSLWLFICVSSINAVASPNAFVRVISIHDTVPISVSNSGFSEGHLKVTDTTTQNVGIFKIKTHSNCVKVCQCPSHSSALRYLKKGGKETVHTERLPNYIQVWLTYRVQFCQWKKNHASNVSTRHSEIRRSSLYTAEIL